MKSCKNCIHGKKIRGGVQGCVLSGSWKKAWDPPYDHCNAYKWGPPETRLNYSSRRKVVEPY